MEFKNVMSEINAESDINKRRQIAEHKDIYEILSEHIQSYSHFAAVSDSDANEILNPIVKRIDALESAGANVITLRRRHMEALITLTSNQNYNAAPIQLVMSPEKRLRHAKAWVLHDSLMKLMDAFQFQDALSLDEASDILAPLKMRIGHLNKEGYNTEFLDLILGHATETLTNAYMVNSRPQDYTEKLFVNGVEFKNAKDPMYVKLHSVLLHLDYFTGKTTTDNAITLKIKNYIDRCEVRANGDLLHADYLLMARAILNGESLNKWTSQLDNLHEDFKAFTYSQINANAEHNTNLRLASTNSNTLKGSSKMDKETKKEKIDRMMKTLDEGVRDVFESDKYKSYLSAMAKFHSYSWRNVMLILNQKPSATYVAGYNKWQSDFNRQVNKGEKGIMILGGRTVKYEPKSNKSKDTNNSEIESPAANGSYVVFYPTYVFDVSQTDGDPLPLPVTELEGNVSNYEYLKDTLIKVSPCPVKFESFRENEGAGYYRLESNEPAYIAIKENMSPTQTIKTLIHEIAHATLHADRKAIPDRITREVQAESVAYIVSKHLGVDSSDYSFPYIATWSKEKDLKELKNSFDTIKIASGNLIDAYEKIKEHEISKDKSSPAIQAER